VSAPLFFGLSHIGQVFSLGWAEKFGSAAVFDFDAAARARFRGGELTHEEPELVPVWRDVHDRISVIDDPARVADHDVVFLTLDTPLDLDGEPDTEAVFAFLRRVPTLLGRDATLILLSQVYPGFCARVRAEVLKDRPDVKLVYMVDTLKMGVAMTRFRTPEQLVFGVASADHVPKEFADFKCPQAVLTHAEAEMVKIAINLYLLVGVSFANAMDTYCRELGFRFGPIADCLRNDERIGRKAYLSPSLGISGGHLERDLSTVLQRCADAGTRALFAQLKAVNDVRMMLLFGAVRDVAAHTPVRRVLWMGASYKAQSFSLVNSPLLKFVRRYGETLDIEVHDGLYEVPALAGMRATPDLAQALGRADLVVLNYARPEDLAVLRDRLTAGTPPVLDISLPDAFAGAAPPAVRRLL